VMGEETGRLRKTKGEAVFRGQVNLNRKKAIKIINKENVKLKDIDRFRKEVKLMKETDHPNIVRLYETFEDGHDIYLILELCQGGELFDRIQTDNKFGERGAANLMQQILQMIAYLHSIGIMHRDIKPENFMFTDKGSPVATSTLKLIDFGLSTEFKKGGKLKTTKVGTPYYVACEVLLDGKYDEKCDVWSCGVIMFIMLCGYPPFFGATDTDTINLVKAANLQFDPKDWEKVSKAAMDLIRGMLEINRERRYSAEKALNDPWIKDKAPQAQDVPLSPEVFDRMKSYKNRNKLEKAALNIIAQQLDHDELSELRGLWRSIDKDNSGRVSLDELKQGASQLVTKNKKNGKSVDAELEDLFRRMDADGSGQIDYTEFLAATVDKKLYAQDEVLWTAFRIFDKDGNGRITRDELDAVLKDDNVNAQFMAETIDRVMEETDANGDGEIDFEEFRDLMTRLDSEWAKKK